MDRSADNATSSDDDTSSSTSGRQLPSSRNATAISTPPWSQMIEHICHLFGIHGLYHLIRKIILRCTGNGWHRSTEEPKIPLIKSWVVTAFAIVPHLVAASAVIALYLLNSWEIYLGSQLPGAPGQQKGKEFAFQLTAKLLELLTISSLGTIIFALIRRSLLAKSGLPLTGLNAGFKWNSITYVLTSEFWLLVPLERKIQFRQYLLVSALLLSMLLAVAIGPASAISLIPQLGLWEVGGAYIWINSTFSRLHPELLSADSFTGADCSIAGTAGCPSESWESLRMWLSLFGDPKDSRRGTLRERRVPEAVFIYTGLDEVFGYCRYRGKLDADDAKTVYTAATMPHFAMANAFLETTILHGRALFASRRLDQTTFADRRSTGYELFSHQPTVRVNCLRTRYESPYVDTWPTFPVRSDPDTIEHAGEMVKNSSLRDQIANKLSNDEGISLQWIGGNELEGYYQSANLSSVFQAAAIVTLPSRGNDEGSAVVCTISAKYVVGRMYLSKPVTSYVGSDNANMNAFDQIDLNDQSVRWCTLDSSLAPYLNPSLPSLNSSVFEQNCIAAGLWSAQDGATDAPEARMEAALALMTASAMAKTERTASLQGNIIGYDGDKNAGLWWRNFMPQPADKNIWQNSPGHGGSPFDLSGNEKLEFYGRYVKATNEGYAYTSKGSSSVRIASAILLTYAAIATLRIITLLVNREVSSAWESANDLIAIAWASPTPGQDQLKNTTGSIWSSAPLRQRVRIVQNQSRLELVCVDEAPDAETVKPNVFSS